MDSSVNSPTESNYWGISGSTLKLVAIITMLIDHIGASILEKIIANNGGYQGTLYNVDQVMRSIGRLAFPIFCFLLVEGMVHTHNKWKYAMRLAIFSLVSEIPFDLAFTGKFVNIDSQNVFFTLFIGLLVMISFNMINEKWRDEGWLMIPALIGIPVAAKMLYSLIEYLFGFSCTIISNFGADISFEMPYFIKVISIILVIIISILGYFLLFKSKTLQTANVIYSDLLVLYLGMTLAVVLHTDYDSFGVLTIVVMYVLRKNYMKSMFGGCLTLTIMSLGECTSFVDLLLIRVYNGKRGLNLKYFFYAFYPVHLLLLYVVCYFMNLV